VPNADVSILHLSDIHAGPGQAKDIDAKDKLPGVERLSMLERLTAYVRALARQPDFVAVTGDLTNAGSLAGLETFRSWLYERIDEGSLPGPERILIVPGNHDVRWGIERGDRWHAERYRDFFQTFATSFPHAHVPDLDPPLSAPTTVSAATGGGIEVELIGGRVKLTSSHPFLLDVERNVLIFAFNSTLGCGIYKDANPVIVERLEALRGVSTNGDVRSQIAEVQAAYKKDLLVDAAYIGDTQLDYFTNVMQVLRTELGSSYAQLTKIAILHHHVSPIWRQQLEVKQFDVALDASQLLQRLFEEQFDLVLHGHKHTNHVGLTAPVRPVSEAAGFRPLAVVSGGTICGHPRMDDRHSFKVITLAGAAPRGTAEVSEIPLLDTGRPEEVIRREAVLYQLPLADRLPGVHDSELIKSRLDDHVRATLAPELAEVGALVSAGAESTLPPADPELVASASSYRFDRLLTLRGDNVFYDLLLLTERLGFRQRARILLMLRDVKSWSRSAGLTARVSLLIGNLEGTAFSRVSEPGEIARSIDELQEWFAPAIHAGLLDVRVLNVNPSEIEKLNLSEVARG
jgi:3',5'-cyclic AMP phosphodiesterase CpdA